MTLLGSQVAHADSVEVKPGDTLSSIAQAHNTTVDSLANINGISNINLNFKRLTQSLLFF